MSSTLKIPIVRCGKDICRLIFTEDKQDCGKYDIKIDFLEKPYSISVYHLFDPNSHKWESDEMINSSITYHHGKNNKPITIHVKNENSNPKYIPLITSNILPPNRNTMFPIPLLKLEIPDCALEVSNDYIPKKKHRPINTQGNNIIELYMANKSVSSDVYFSNKYELMLYPQMVMPIEYFATYCATMDSIKYENFIPKGKPEIRGIWVKDLKNLSLHAFVYPWPQMNSKLNKIRVTFLENKLAEEILLCTLLSYPKIYYLTGECQYLYMGNANLNQLKSPISEDDVFKSSYLPDSTVSETIRRGYLSPLEIVALAEKTSKARKKLYEALRIHKNMR